ncbi:MAG: hypothetical protein LQ338_005465 [Usnochroma carphineum]|nr:MAG: hypothetical protein LQ338_005465 [Usnochroma carphineum]
MPFYESTTFGQPKRPTNLYQLLEQAATDPAGHGISVYLPGNLRSGKRVTYAGLLELARANASLLPPVDPNRDDQVVLLHFDNHFDNIEWFWSVLIAGYIPAISTPFTNDREQRAKHITHLKTLLKNPVFLTTERLVPDFLGIEGLRLESIEAIQRRKKVSLIDFAGRPKHADSTAVLMLTSGSTGNAKAVCLRHSQLLRSIRGKSEHHGTNKSDTFLNWIGLDHVANLTESHLHSMLHASEQIHVQAADLLVSPQTLLTLISKHRVTHSFAPNFFLASLRAALEKPQPFAAGEEPDLSRFRILISGGEANVVETSEKLTALLQSYKLPADTEVIRPGFGMTETCAGSIYSKKCPSYDIEYKLEFNSLGTCIPGLTMRITNDDGKPAATDESGNLELSGDILFREYFNNPKATAEAFTEDGWFITGDRAMIDKNGYLNLTGRSKESIIINGVKYFPHELETAIENANVEGLTPSYTAVFPHRPKGYQTEVLCVVYLPTYDPKDVLARVSATDAISRTSTMAIGVKPYQIIPLERSLLPKSSLGKLSRTKIRTAFETRVYAKYQEENDKILQTYRAAQRQAPSNQTEATILRLFAELFELSEDDIGTNTSLFEMGVSSIEIIKLKTQIQKALEMEVEIPVITMMTNPTIKSLAAALIELQEPKVYSPVVTLQAGGSKTPLWLVHPGVGEILVFLNLAKYIVDRPVYALRARGFDEGETYFEDIPEVIQTYHAAIKEKQPEGPYAIAGYSYGAMIAFNITKVLESNGDKVPFLGVFNLPPHIKFRMRQLDWTEVILNLSYFLDLISEEYAHEISPDMHELSHDGVLDFIISKAPPTRMEEMALDKKKLTNWADLAYRMQAIAQHYDPSGTVSGMDVFYAIPLAAVAKSKKQWLDEHLSKWSEFVSETPRFHEVDGAHYTMISPLHVFSFQKILRAALQERGI